MYIVELSKEHPDLPVWEAQSLGLKGTVLENYLLVNRIRNLDRLAYARGGRDSGSVPRVFANAWTLRAGAALLCPTTGLESRCGPGQSYAGQAAIHALWCLRYQAGAGTPGAARQRAMHVPPG